jgi:hypothetical protein
LYLHKKLQIFSPSADVTCWRLRGGAFDGAYALGTGTKRKVWVFRLSELAAAIVEKKQCTSVIQNRADRGMIRNGSPR